MENIHESNWLTDDHITYFNRIHHSKQFGHAQNTLRIPLWQIGNTSSVLSWAHGRVLCVFFVCKEEQQYPHANSSDGKSAV